MRARLMPNPVKHKNGTYYLLVTVPADIAKEARGTSVSIPIGDTWTTTKIGVHAKASLRTKDRLEARRRFPVALAAVEAHWDSLRHGPADLSHKQALALAGEVRQVFVEVLDDNPGGQAMWERVQKWDDLVQRGLTNELQVGERADEAKLVTLDARYGGFVDAVLRRHSLQITEASRAKVIRLTAKAMSEAVEVNLAKAKGDYSDTGETAKYPAFDGQPTPTAAVVTLTSILNKRIEDKAKGKDAKPLGDSAIKRMRRVIAEFDANRGSTDVGSITPADVDGWKGTLQAKAQLSNNTIKQRLQDLSTIINYGIKQSYGDLFPKGNPASSKLVERPEAIQVPSDQRTYRLDEARIVLQATRTCADCDETRWIPWLCAYSGARVGEVEQLTVQDVYQVEGRWFMRLTTMGRKSLKNKYGERRIPLHRDVIDEGFISFVEERKAGGAHYVFNPSRGQQLVRDWVRNSAKITRKELPQNHGWRHLFEDWAMRSGLNEAACTYITGRTRGKSQEWYGKSEAMLPGLAREMDKLHSFLEDS